MAIDKIVEFVENLDPDKINPKFQEYLTKVRPMTGAGVVQLLNGCVKLIDEDKCYLEVGTHRGSTLLGAAMDNITMCYGVDNFLGHNSSIEVKPFKNVEEGLQDAISRLSAGNVAYFKSDYKEFLKDREEVGGKKVEVYFYDGDHKAENQYEGLELALPLLAKESLIIIDDTGYQDKEAAWYGIEKLLKEEKGVSFVRKFDSPVPNNLYGMWQGVVVLKRFI
jgi:hypothetical protein